MIDPQPVTTEAVGGELSVLRNGPPDPLQPRPSATSFAANWVNAFFSLLVIAFLLLLPLYIGDDPYYLPEFNKYIVLAIFALGVDLIWGYTGMLSLGQGLYFGLGAYALAFYLKFLQAAQEAGLPPGSVVRLDYMLYGGLNSVPGWLAPLADFRVALACIILLPTLVATLFGMITFRLRIKGVYFSLITQALVLAIFTLFENQLPYTNGKNGLNGLAKFTLFGQPVKMQLMYYLGLGALLLCYLGCVGLMLSRFGKVLTAIRDSETRVLALGYNVAMYKTFIFALAAAMSGLAGALFVVANLPAACGPDYFSIGFSIEIVIFVAVGGRGTLIGAILGTILVRFANTWFNDTFQKGWPIILGLLFIMVVVFLPEGIIGLLRKLTARLFRSSPSVSPTR